MKLFFRFLLLSLVVMSASCLAMSSVVEFGLEVYTLHDIDNCEMETLRGGFKNAFKSLPSLNDQSMNRFFQAGIDLVKSGTFKLARASQKSDSTYCVHLLYGNETYEGHEWTRVKHCGYSDNPLCKAAFEFVFRAIHVETRRDPAILIEKNGNLDFIALITELGFAPDESIKVEDPIDIWYVRRYDDIV